MEVNTFQWMIYKNPLFFSWEKKHGFSVFPLDFPIEFPLKKSTVACLWVPGSAPQAATRKWAKDGMIRGWKLQVNIQI